MFLNNYAGRILSDVGMEMKEPFRLRKERMRKGKNDFCSIDFFFVWARNAQACRQVGISKIIAMLSNIDLFALSEKGQEESMNYTTLQVTEQQ